MVIGMTDNLTARKIFEEKFKSALVQRNINAVESENIIDPSFTGSKKSEAQIDDMVAGLSKDGFDAVIITAVKGVDEQESYSPGHYQLGLRWSRFGRYYYRYQDVYYTPGYYDQYKIYHVETSIYNLKGETDKALVWVGSFNIVNPQDISTTVSDYVSRTIAQLEKEGLINQL